MIHIYIYIYIIHFIWIDDTNCPLFNWYVDVLCPRWAVESFLVFCVGYT